MAWCVMGRYGYMIDNIILLITGTLHQRPITELINKCHPLGSFEQMEAIHIASTPAELYNAVLVDTPLGKILRLFISFLFSGFFFFLLFFSLRNIVFGFNIVYTGKKAVLWTSLSTNQHICVFGNLIITFVVKGFCLWWTGYTEYVISFLDLFQHHIS